MTTQRPKAHSLRPLYTTSQPRLNSTWGNPGLPWVEMWFFNPAFSSFTIVSCKLSWSRCGKIATWGFTQTTHTCATCQPVASACWMLCMCSGCQYSKITWLPTCCTNLSFFCCFICILCEDNKLEEVRLTTSARASVRYNFMAHERSTEELCQRDAVNCGQSSRLLDLPIMSCMHWFCWPWPGQSASLFRNLNIEQIQPCSFHTAVSNLGEYFSPGWKISTLLWSKGWF